LGIGDWGLGIGPNPQSPIPSNRTVLKIKYLRHEINNFELKMNNE